jgi:hypothetical protein
MMGWHVPIAASVEVHVIDVGQPLPEVARQPGTQREMAVSHTRPDV